MAFQKILVFIEPDTGWQPALEQAAAFAKASGGEIIALHCVYDLAAELSTLAVGTILKNAKKPLIAQQETWLADILQRLKEQDISVTGHTVWSKHPYKTALDLIKTHSVDFVIKLTHKHKTLDRLLFKSADWQLLHGCHVPMLFIHDYFDLAGKKVLMAVDSANEAQASLNKTILETGAYLKTAFGCQLALVHAYPTIVGLSAYTAELDPATLEKTQKELEFSHREKTLRLASAYHIPGEAVTLQSGPVNQIIEQTIEQLSPDLLIVGSHSGKGIPGVLFGHSFESFIDQIRCNLWVVKF